MKILPVFYLKKVPIFSDLSLRVMYRWTMEDQEKKTREIRSCERLIVQAVENCPLVGLLLKALKERGCGVSLLRHLVCERCRPGLAGGYDRQTNQIVICSNYSDRLQEVQQTLRQLLNIFFLSLTYLSIYLGFILAMNLYTCTTTAQQSQTSLVWRIWHARR